ncbi:hypothetical protein CSC81_19025, partial [Tenacibaculum discolor]
MGASWSTANANRPRRSTAAVVWFKPRVKTVIARDYKILPFAWVAAGNATSPDLMQRKTPSPPETAGMRAAMRAEKQRRGQGVTGLRLALRGPMGFLDGLNH